ncbi:MAG: homocysteine S-methyltransferase family protein [Desulfobulbaceae bacterium]|nr:homocysteine S-methyltransferase family protein [Desulfobulbaceae bacterium]
MTISTDASKITLLDGGMGRQLLHMGAPFRQPEWSALALIEAPDFVRRAHEDFAAAGSDVLTTNSYAVVPFHLGEARFAAKGAALAALSGRLAAEAAAPFGCRVAGSLPPVFGSYRPDLFDPIQAPALLRVLIDALDPHVDLWLAETLGSIAEAEAVGDALFGDDRPAWFAYTLMDGDEMPGDVPRLRSGEMVGDAVSSAVDLGAAAILFNCSQPEVMGSAIDMALDELHSLGTELPVGAYANAFAPQKKDAQANTAILEIRSDLDPAGYLAFADDWRRRGATIIGGCCGIGPEHIAALSTMLKAKRML